MNNDLPKRKMPRLKNFDYNTTGAYFITICTKNRAELLSHIVGTGVPDCPYNIEFLPYGKTADKHIKQLNDFYDDISIDQYVIMPNHIHLLLSVRNGQSGTPVPTNHEPIFAKKALVSKDNKKANSIVSRFVSTFKRFCNKEYGQNIWQDRFYDHVIRNREDYNEHVKYIYENPMNWYYDELYTNK